MSDEKEKRMAENYKITHGMGNVCGMIRKTAARSA